MDNDEVLNVLKNQFFMSFSMLENIIEICPDDLWNTKKSGFVFWQPIFHTFAGMQYWLRDGNTPFVFEPFIEENVHPELEGEPEKLLQKEDVKKCCNAARAMGNKWFDGKNDNWIKLPSKIYSNTTNLEIIASQIRHLMYHIGHCEAIFRENGTKVGTYLDFIE
jgi:hypothetical protein